MGFWYGFGAEHIFPLAYESHWCALGYNDLVTLMPSRGGAINSVQNGLLLREDLHSLFDNYIFSINPDVRPYLPIGSLPWIFRLTRMPVKDNFKIVFFFDLDNDLPGTYLDSPLVKDSRGPHPELLRWHFRQAILTNVTGDGAVLRARLPAWLGHGRRDPVGTQGCGEDGV